MGSFGSGEELGGLAFQTSDAPIDHFVGLQRALPVLARRVADEARRPTQQNDDLTPSTLVTVHPQKRDQAARVQAAGAGVIADVQGRQRLGENLIGQLDRLL